MEDNNLDAELRRGVIDRATKSYDKDASDSEVKDGTYMEIVCQLNDVRTHFRDNAHDDLEVDWKYPGNWVQTVTIIGDLMAFLNPPFYKGIWWSDDSSANDAIQVWGFELTSSNIYNACFWLSLAICVCYPPIAYYGYKLLTYRDAKFPDGKLGRDAYGNEAKVFSWMGIFLIVLSSFSSAAFFPVVKTLMNTIICVYPDDGTDPYHVKMTDTQCWTDVHFFYVGAAGAGLLLYFPLATFLYPHIQFGDPGLDIKYAPGYLIGLNVCKLLNAGCLLFLGAQGALKAMLCCCFVIVVMAFLLDYMMEPGLIPWSNQCRRYGYFFAAMACGCALVVEITGWVMVWAIVLGLVFVLELGIMSCRMCNTACFTRMIREESAILTSMQLQRRESRTSPAQSMEVQPADVPTERWFSKESPVPDLNITETKRAAAQTDQTDRLWFRGDTNTSDQH